MAPFRLMAMTSCPPYEPVMPLSHLNFAKTEQTVWWHWSDTGNETCLFPVSWLSPLIRQSVASPTHSHMCRHSPVSLSLSIRLKLMCPRRRYYKSLLSAGTPKYFQLGSSPPRMFWFFCKHLCSLQFATTSKLGGLRGAAKGDLFLGAAVTKLQPLGYLTPPGACCRTPPSSACVRRCVNRSRVNRREQNRTESVLTHWRDSSSSKVDSGNTCRCTNLMITSSMSWNKFSPMQMCMWTKGSKKPFPAQLFVCVGQNWEVSLNKAYEGGLHFFFPGLKYRVNVRASGGDFGPQACEFGVCVVLALLDCILYCISAQNNTDLLQSTFCKHHKSPWSNPSHE